MRTGGYRISYVVQDDILVVVVIRVGRREKDTYKKL